MKMSRLQDELYLWLEYVLATKNYQPVAVRKLIGKIV
jgi:hypothetical protein